LPSSPIISYTPRNTSAEDEIGALSSVYYFILFESKASKKGARPGAPDDVRKGQDAHTANSNYTD
jgi:hypothetical protein